MPFPGCGRLHSAIQRGRSPRGHRRRHQPHRGPPRSSKGIGRKNPIRPVAACARGRNGKRFARVCADSPQPAGPLLMRPRPRCWLQPPGAHRWDRRVRHPLDRMCDPLKGRVRRSWVKKPLTGQLSDGHWGIRGFGPFRRQQTELTQVPLRSLVPPSGRHQAAQAVRPVTPRRVHPDDEAGDGSDPVTTYGEQ